MKRMNAMSITKARSILGAASKTIPDDIVLAQVIGAMELLSEIIINEMRGSKDKSVLDFLELMKDNRA